MTDENHSRAVCDEQYRNLALKDEELNIKVEPCIYAPLRRRNAVLAVLFILKFGGNDCENNFARRKYRGIHIRR